MQLPNEATKTAYLKAQKEALLDAIFKNEVEVSFNNRWLDECKTAEDKRKTKAEIARLNETILGQIEYVGILNEFLNESDTELTDAQKRVFLEQRVLEQKKGNFRGVVATRLSEYRKDATEDQDVKDAEDENIESYNNAMLMNEITLELCESLIKTLR